METRGILGSIAGALLMSGAAVLAGQEPVQELTLARRADVLAARVNPGAAAAPVIGSSPVQVVGFVWREDDTPVEHPALRIRSRLRGQVAARTTGSVLGEFRFDELDGGSYLIELLDTEDRILAVGQPLTVLPGDTVGTFIRLSDPRGSFDDRGFAVIDHGERFGGSAPAVVQTADDAGVTSLGGGNVASNER